MHSWKDLRRGERRRNSQDVCVCVCACVCHTYLSLMAAFIDCLAASRSSSSALMRNCNRFFSCTHTHTHTHTHTQTNTNNESRTPKPPLLCSYIRVLRICMFVRVTGKAQTCVAAARLASVARSFSCSSLMIALRPSAADTSLRSSVHTASLSMSYTHTHTHTHMKPQRYQHIQHIHTHIRARARNAGQRRAR